MRLFKQWFKREARHDVSEFRSEAKHLRRLSTALAQDTSLQAMANLVAVECRSAFGADATCVYLSQPGGYFEMLAESGCSEQFKTEWSRLPKEIFPLAVADNPQDSIFIGSANDFKREMPVTSNMVDHSKRKTIAYAPFVINKNVIGLIGFSYNHSMECPNHKTYVLTIVNFCAQALERVRLVETAQLARLQAEAANKAKTDFLTNISHEIRTPIGVIQGFTDMLLDSEGLNIKHRHWASVILRNTQQLTSLIGEVLDISKIESEKIEVEMREFSLHDLLEDLKTMAGFKAKEKGIGIKFKQQSVPRRISTDPTRLRQILTNLVGNAIKFTVHGMVHVQVNYTTEHVLEVEVKDTGIGIPHESQSIIFDPFIQADTSTRRRFGGTGLGLTISKRLAEALGGDVKLIHSSPGRGSTFLFTLPCMAMAGMNTDETRQTHGDKNQGKHLELEGLKILLVEDSLDNQDLISSLLIREGAVVDVADTGVSGVQKALHNNYNVVLMDIQMPGLDGHGAVAMLRTQGYSRPIAALTAHVLSSERQKSLREGFDAYLTKPIDRLALIRSLKRLGFRGAG